jgi:hypothetical protein
LGQPVIADMLLLLHDVAATALLILISWQCFIAWSPRATSQKFSFGRSPAPFELRDMIGLLFVATVLLGGFLYPAYRFNVRPVLEINDLRSANGSFEIKEQFAALGLIMLPAYRAAWASSDVEKTTVARRSITTILCSIVWWNFAVGHIMNLIKGLS